MIETVAIVGLGALGVMYGTLFREKLSKEQVRIVCDEQRKARYEKDGVFCNGVPCDFYYVDSEEIMGPADLVIFAVKGYQLEQAIPLARHQIGDKTIILSVMNGIVSEEEIGAVYGPEKLLYSTVQGMDSTKSGNSCRYVNKGSVTFGEKDDKRTWKTAALAGFLDRMEIPYEIPENMMSRMWAKLMLNDGVNQSAAVFETNYGGIHQDGEPRRVMIGAMREVMQVAESEQVPIEEGMLERFVALVDSLSPEGEPSLRQDTRQKRKTEVDYFAGTIRRLAAKHGISVPFNDFLYEGVKRIENSYLEQK